MKHAIATGMFVAVLSSAAFAQKWKPYQFKGNERYEYKVTSYDKRKGAQEVVYILDIRDVGIPSEGGEKQFDVSWTAKSRIKAKELGPQTAFGVWGTFGIQPSWIIMNPLYAGFWQQMDLKVGASKSFFGAMNMEVTEKTEVGGREGFLCKMTDPKKNQAVMEWVIDPALALPIRSAMYQKGKAAYQMELLSFKKG